MFGLPIQRVACIARGRSQQVAGELNFKSVIVVRRTYFLPDMLGIGSSFQMGVFEMQQDSLASAVRLRRLPVPPLPAPHRPPARPKPAASMPRSIRGDITDGPLQVVAPVSFTVTSVDTAEDIVVAEATISYAYSPNSKVDLLPHMARCSALLAKCNTPSQVRACYSGCCRVPNLLGKHGRIDSQLTTASNSNQSTVPGCSGRWRRVPALCGAFGESRPPGRLALCFAALACGSHCRLVGRRGCDVDSRSSPRLREPPRCLGTACECFDRRRVR